MNQQSIRQDERLQNLDIERFKRLTQLADRLYNTPENMKMSVFLSILQEMKSDHLTFSPDEQDLLFTVLTENMNEKEKKKAMMIRQLSSQLAK